MDEATRSALLATLRDLCAAVGPAGRAAKGAPRGLVLFMTEHGFTGAFNDELVDAARLAMSGGEALFLVGSRGRVLVEERGLTPVWAIDMALHARAVIDTARRTVAALYHHFERGTVAAVEILYFRDRGGGRRTLERQSLLPVDLGRFRPPALRYLHAPI